MIHTASHTLTRMHAVCTHYKHLLNGEYQRNDNTAAAEEKKLSQQHNENER